MKPERLIDSTETPGGDELFLYERDGVFTLRIGGIELMTSRVHDSEEELARVEREAFLPVLSDIPLKIQEMTLEEAKAYGAIAHFEEEYRGKEKVRVVEVPGVSKELCGGTHVRRTGEIGPIVILAEEAVAAGTRRIRALVGERARSYLSAIRDERRKLARLLKVPEGEVVQAVERLARGAARLRGAALHQRIRDQRWRQFPLLCRDRPGSLCGMRGMSG